MLTFAPLPHVEAVARIEGLPVVTREVMDGLLPELRAYAFCISGVEAMDQVSRVRDLVAAVPAGEQTWAEAKKAIIAELEEDLGEGAERRAELLLRTHTFRAYAAARYRSLMEQRDVFPWWQYKTHGDGKVRPAHAALNGKIFPAGHEIWQKIFPPWDWGCRCLVVPLMGDDVDPAEQRRLQEARDQAVTDGGLLETQRHSPKVYTTEESTAMANAGRLYLPNGQTVSLNPSPTWSASPWSEKGSVRHTWPMIRERYAHDPEALDAFESWAKQTGLGDGQSVWSWVNGSSASFAQPLRRSRVGRTVDVPEVRAAAIRRAVLETADVNVGGVPDLAADLPEVARHAEDFAHEITSDNHENAAVWDEAGNLLQRERGLPNQVSLEARHLPGNVTVHNHPAGKPPSPQDIEAVLQHRIKELRVVTRTHTYIVRPGPQAGDITTLDAVAGYWQEISEVDAVAAGMLDPDAVDGAANHAGLVWLAQQGIIQYSRTAR